MIDYAIHIEAPADVVFEMFTDPALLTEWMAAEARTDVRPGGEFRWTYENGDVVLGRFLAIEPPHRLVLAYGWELPVERAIPPGSTEVEITFADVDGGTDLRLVHRGLPAAELASHTQGWQYFLGRLVERVAGRTTTGGRHA